MTDTELIREYFAQRSEEAFRELVRRHIGLVFGVAMRQVAGDEHLAQDVAQRVFVALMRKAGTLQHRATLAGWLYTAARLEAVRAVRSEGRRRERESKAEFMNAPPSSPDESATAWESLRPVLDDAMAELGESDREAIVQRYFAGKSFPELGKLLGLSDEAARKRVDRAVDKLRHYLQRRGMVSTASALGLALEAHASAAASPAVLAAVTQGAWSEAATISAAQAGLLMGTSKLVGGIAGAVVALAAVVVVHDIHALREARSRAEDARIESAAATRQHDDLSAQWAALQRKTAANAAAAAAPAAGKSADSARSYLTNSAYRELSKNLSLARRHLEFQRLYRKLGLSPDQIARFEEIMMQQDQANLDAQVARDSGEDPQTVYKRSGEEWTSAMKSLLGSPGFDQLQDYLRTMPVRRFVDSLATEIPPGGAALTVDQADRLAQLALANDSTYQQGKGTDPGTVNWTAVWDPADQILTPSQQATFQMMVESWSLDKQVQGRIRELAASHP